LGINFARDGMARKEWLALVAVHSDAWLMSVAFYYGAKLNGDQRYCTSEQENNMVTLHTVLQNVTNKMYYRRQLFAQLNSSPTLFELVTGKADYIVGSKRPRIDIAVRTLTLALALSSVLQKFCTMTFPFLVLIPWNNHSS
jgi:hypothetical protein